MASIDRQSISAQTLARMRDLRRRGHGVKLNDWQVEAFDPSAPHTLIESVVDWCKGLAGESRRPYGINAFDLTLAFRVGGDKDVRSHTFTRLKPMELYDDSFAARLLDMLGLHVAKPSPLRVSAGYFSWGDAAYQALNAPK
jgi:hypothetical protein